MTAALTLLVVWMLAYPPVCTLVTWGEHRGGVRWTDATRAKISRVQSLIYLGVAVLLVAAAAFSAFLNT